MDLCALCRSIPFEELPAAPKDESISCVLGIWQNPALYICSQESALGLGHLYHDSIESLAESASACRLCELVHEGVVSWSKRYWDKYHGEAEFRKKLYKDHAEWFPFPSGQQLYLTRRENGSPGFWVLSTTSRQGRARKIVYLLTAVGFCVKPDDPMAEKIRLRPLEADPSSAATFATAKEWLNTCMEGHDECAKGQHTLPSRILDLGTADADQIKLVESNGVVGEYATLSHCWGMSDHFTTSTENIALRKKGIPTKDLPKTFYDAVSISWALGFRYLWIDSLCICQDDHKDWSQESARMVGIYSNASLVIAANSAANNSVGCLKWRPERRLIDLPIGKDSDRHNVKAMLLWPGNEARYFEDQAWGNEPLSGRAWALQERLLGTRILQYCSDQMYFECDRGVVGEDGCRYNGRYCNIRNASPSIGGEHSRWYEMLFLYGTRNLTKPSDKFPALSGIAKTFASRIKADYMAGIWTDAIVEGLFWQCLSPLEVQTVDYHPEYVAPSWSWASYDGVAATSSDDWWVDVAAVEGYDWKQKDENPFGEIEHAWIRLRAPLVPLTIVQPLSKWYDEMIFKRLRTPRVSVVGDTNEKVLISTIDRPKDADIDMLQGFKLFALVLRSKETAENKEAGKEKEEEEEEEEEGTFYACLLVTPAEKDGEMRRLGWLFLEGDAIQDERGVEAFSTTLTLV